MSAILKFDFQKGKQLRFSEVNYLNYTKKPNFACDNYIFPKTRRNKNKQWTHFRPVKNVVGYSYLLMKIHCENFTRKIFFLKVIIRIKMLSLFLFHFL